MSPLSKKPWQLFGTGPSQDLQHHNAGIGYLAQHGIFENGERYWPCNLAEPIDDNDKMDPNQLMHDPNNPRRKR